MEPWGKDVATIVFETGRPARIDSFADASGPLGLAAREEGVGIGSGKLVPALATGAAWPYTAIGIGFAIAGVFCSGYAFWRYREVEEAVSRAAFAPPDERLVACSPASAPRWEFSWSSCS